MAHKVIVMRHGEVIEEGDTETLFEQPKNEYTKILLQASLFRETN
jgi:ABC-type microcin C transport system duplicated ATPase subunit YejF